MYMLNKKDLKALLNKWSEEFNVFSPMLEQGQVMLLPYEEISFTMDYINFAFPVKEYLFKQKNILFNWKKNNESINVSYLNKEMQRSSIYFGIRACDVYGIRYMDKFFLEGYRDDFYGRNRDNAIIAAVNCSEAGENCFCSSLGTGHFAKEGYDILFTPLEDTYLIEIATNRGEILANASKDFLVEVSEDVLDLKESIEKAVLDTFKIKINSQNVSTLLGKNYNNPLWEKLSKECISCTGCTSLCPTCTCFNVVEEVIDESSGTRVRYWDSCQSDSFTRNAGNHNPRNSTARVRYRIYDKFKYIEDKFNMKGCTGCGRCINVCPASINVVDIINNLESTGKSLDGSGGD